MEDIVQSLMDSKHISR